MLLLLQSLEALGRIDTIIERFVGVQVSCLNVSELCCVELFCSLCCERLDSIVFSAQDVLLAKTVAARWKVGICRLRTVHTVRTLTGESEKQQTSGAMRIKHISAMPHLPTQIDVSRFFT